MALLCCLLIALLLPTPAHAESISILEYELDSAKAQLKATEAEIQVVESRIDEARRTHRDEDVATLTHVLEDLQVQRSNNKAEVSLKQAQVDKLRPEKLSQAAAPLPTPRTQEEKNLYTWTPVLLALAMMGVSIGVIISRPRTCKHV